MEENFADDEYSIGIWVENERIAELFNHPSVVYPVRFGVPDGEADAYLNYIASEIVEMGLFIRTTEDRKRASIGRSAEEAASGISQSYSAGNIN